MIVNCFIFDRTTRLLRDSATSYAWSRAVDGMSSAKSTFNTTQSVNPNHGDFIIVKAPGVQKPLFVGVVDSYENKKISALPIIDILDFEIVATAITGTDAFAHLDTLIRKYLLLDSEKEASSIILKTSTEKISFSYKPNDPPVRVVFKDYLRDFFIKYGIVWSVSDISYTTNGLLNINTILERPTWTLQFKDSAACLQNWNLLVSPSKPNGENKLVIIDKATTDMMNPLKLSSWYISSVDGSITSNPSVAILPTREKVYIYDQTQTDPPTHISVAQSELSVSQYEHEIEVDLIPGSPLISQDQIQLGTICTVVISGVSYSSIITGYASGSDSEVLTIQLGYIRSTLQSILSTFERK